MLTNEQLRTAIDQLNEEPLSVAEIKNMFEILAGLVRNLPLRSNYKNTLLLQLYLGELAVDSGGYNESALVLSTFLHTLNSYSQRGLLPQSLINYLIYLANLIAEVLAFLLIILGHS